MPFVKLKDRGQMTLPQELRRQFNLSAGDVLEARAQGATIVLIPKAIIDKQEEEAIVRLFQQVQEEERTTPTPATKLMAEFYRAAKPLAKRAKELGITTEEAVVNIINEQRTQRRRKIKGGA